MNNYFENKITCNQISFHLSDKPIIDEREIHSYHEILLYMGDSTNLLTKNGRKPIKSHSVIIIPKEEYHFFRLKHGESFKRLKISFPHYAMENFPSPSLMNELKIFENLNENIRHAFDRLYSILKTQTDKTPLYAYSAFLLLLTELDIFGEEKKR